MQIIDTHCHIHDSEFFLENREEAYRLSREADVAMVCVGTTVQSSREAIEFCRTHEASYPVVGIHPHDAKDNGSEDIRALVEANKGIIIGIGEIGLDYFYDHSPREVQMERLREQLHIASDYNLPVSFHVREAFEDFWPILDEFSGITGVMHSFTDTKENADEALKRGLFIGVNGISTFTKDPVQQQMYASIPLEKMLLETDAPYLTPAPLRGTMNEPSFVGRVAEHVATQRNVSLSDVVDATTANARRLFNIT